MGYLFSATEHAPKYLESQKFNEFLNHHNNQGSTALSSIVHRDKPMIFSKLLCYGADYSIPCGKNNAELHSASLSGFGAMIQILHKNRSSDPNLSKFQRLLNARNASGESVVWAAADAGRMGTIVKQVLTASLYQTSKLGTYFSIRVHTMRE